MKSFSRWLGLLALAMGMAGAMSTAGAATDYPNRPVRLLVGFGPGGPTDITFRKLAELASKELGQQIIVENKPGVGATLAPSSMAKSEKPDGYTIAAATAGVFRVPHMQKVDWNPIEDFTWISGLGGYTFVLAVRDDSPFNTVEELIEYAKSHPEEISVGTAGAGTTMHLLTAALGDMAGVDLTHIGFKSSSENVVNLLGGHTHATVDAVGSLLPHMEAGKVRVLMTFDEEPAPWLPNVPTAKSLGYDLAYPAPYGLVGPKGMPDEVVAKLAAAFKVAIDSPEYAQLLDQLRQTYWYRGPAEYPVWAREFFQSERSLVERANLLYQP